MVLATSMQEEMVQLHTYQHWHLNLEHNRNPYVLDQTAKFHHARSFFLDRRVFCFQLPKKQVSVAELQEQHTEV
jgi:hypothetical protein